tara:strand:+ start:1185 stop:1742 length:558 start_codon:yes stop_codon:yes gene_type:complete
MKKLLLILFLVLFSFGAKAQKEYKYQFPHELPIGFSVLCEEEKAIGFDWKNNKYVQSNYKTSKVILKKISPKTKGLLGKICKSKLERFNKKYPWSFVFPRCYSFQYMGKKASFRLCEEFYSRDNSKIEQISCGQINPGDMFEFNTFKFNPDGLFLSKPNDGSFDVDSDTDYKDSFSISHGKCARF